MDEEITLLEAQQGIHEMIAKQSPLQEVLAAISDWMEKMMPGAQVSIMRFDSDRNTLSLVPSPRFSDRYTSEIQDVPVGPGSGTCGTAAYKRETVITEDIASDPRWDGFREAVEAEGFAACCSHPIIDSSGNLLGTFAAYYRSPTYPSRQAQACLARGAALVALAMLRDREAHDHLELSQWHRTLFDNAPFAVYTLDLHGYFQSANRLVGQISGYTKEQILGSHFNKLLDPEHSDHTNSAFERARDGESVNYETAIISQTGRTVAVEIFNFPVIINSKIVGVYGIGRDITARKERELEMRMLKRGVDASTDSVLMVDATHPDMPIVYANPAFTAITGYSQEECLGRNCRFLQGPGTDPAGREIMRAGLENQSNVDVVLRNYRKDGTPFWNHLQISPVLDDQGKCTHFIGIQRDITRERKQEAQLLYQATHDVLTGLSNQTTFTEALNDAFRSHEAVPGQLITLCLNLDNFKPINEELGRRIGDKVLINVAKRLGRFAGPQTVVARLSGDEFGMLLTQQVSQESVTKLADRILESLSRPIKTNGRMIHLSASIGIACNSLKLKAPSELMRCADLALQEARRQGRNTWQWYRGEKIDGIKDATGLRHDLFQALQRDQFLVHYQPIVDATSGHIRSVEALVRWQHPDRGLISPGEFIPLAEKTGQIIALGEWILKQVCQEVTTWNSRKQQSLPVAVNISSMQFHREGFLEFIQKTLQDTGMNPKLLELEVTESVLLDGAKPVIDLMDTLNAMGISVALDDFGTGFSSLSYMRDLPTHKVKLDRSFVQHTKTDYRMAAIVQGVITMAHHMNMSVVAEGIETEEQHHELAQRQCDLLQGYFFARPMPLDELIALPDRLPKSRGNTTS